MPYWNSTIKLRQQKFGLAGQLISVTQVCFQLYSIAPGDPDIRVISECCLISFIAKPEDWYPFIENRKVEFVQLREQKTKVLQQKVASDFIKQLSRESMVKRLE